MHFLLLKTYPTLDASNHALCTYHNYVQLYYEQHCLTPEQICCSSEYYAHSKTFLHFGLKTHMPHGLVAAEIH